MCSTDLAWFTGEETCGQQGRLDAGRILKHFTRWQTPLGVAPAYIGRLREDLTSFYDDPLKRMFIEATYSGS